MSDRIKITAATCHRRDADQDSSVSRPPQAEEVCALFAGVAWLISAVQHAQFHRQAEHACLCHGHR
jgi:hypothetical protein